MHELGSSASGGLKKEVVSPKLLFPRTLCKAPKFALYLYGFLPEHLVNGEHGAGNFLGVRMALCHTQL